MRAVLPTALLLFLASSALADPPKAVIVGPTDGVPGDLIEMDFSESVADKMKIYVEPARFSDGKPTYKLSDDGKKAYMASRAGSVFRVELLVSNAEGPDRAVLICTISSPTPIPAPPPPVNPLPPVPPPVNPLPVGKFGLAPFVQTQVLSNVPQAQRNLCAGFSGNYGTVASQIGLGVIKTLADANAKLKTLNQTTAGTQLDFWKTAVFAPLSAKQQALATAGTLNAAAMDDIKTAFEEIRDGFAAAGAQ